MMAHYSLVDGNLVLSEHDLAKEIYKYIEEKDVVTIYGSKTNKGVSLNTTMQELPESDGIYVIYYKDSFNQLVPAYAGQSDGHIRYRVYRFVKELAGKSRPDETHPGARLLRRLGIMKHDDDIYVKYITKHERNTVVVNALCDHLRLENIDEHIAYISGAIANKRIKKA